MYTHTSIVFALNDREMTTGRQLLPATGNTLTVPTAYQQLMRNQISVITPHKLPLILTLYFPDSILASVLT